MSRNALFLLMGCAAVAFGANTALAQAPEADPPRGEVIFSSPQSPQGREFDPFLPPGSEMRRPRSEHSYNSGVGGPGSGAKSEFGFDELLTPGTRGAKRSLGHRWGLNDGSRMER